MQGGSSYRKWGNSLWKRSKRNCASKKTESGLRQTLLLNSMKHLWYGGMVFPNAININLLWNRFKCLSQHLNRMLKYLLMFFVKCTSASMHRRIPHKTICKAANKLPNTQFNIYTVTDLHRHQPFYGESHLDVHSTASLELDNSLMDGPPNRETLRINKTRRKFI